MNQLTTKISNTRFLSDKALDGKDSDFIQAVNKIKDAYSFDFVSIGLSPFYGAPLKWIYRTGSISNRTKNISLAPGTGIGGIVLKTGRPMLLSNINKELNPQDYASFPIVFAEDLHCFCALPLAKSNTIVGVLLCAFRSVKESNANMLRALVNHLNGKFLSFDIISHDFIDVEFLHELEIEQREFSQPTRISLALSSQEVERKRISRQLHDNIAQELLGLGMQIDNLEVDNLSKKQLETLDACKERIIYLIDEVRALSSELRPAVLDTFGLFPALKSQISLYEKKFGPQIIFDTNCNPFRFDKFAELQVFRICQEALFNSCKYSNSDIILLSIEKSINTLDVVIADEGCGFDTSNIPIRGTGCGLRNMKERAEAIQGKLSICSNSEGTRIALEVPITDLEQEEA